MENETTGLSVDQLNRETESASRHSSNGQILWSKEIKHGTEARAGVMSRQAEECVQNAKGLRGLKGWGQTSQGCTLMLRL